jgi:large subunit ribosomal protein L18
MDKAQEKRLRRRRAHGRVRRSVQGSTDRPRLAVYKSLKYVYAQVIDDLQGVTLVQANSSEPEILKKLEGGSKSKAAARIVGETLGERAKAKGIEAVVFDRGGYIFHGKVKEVAAGARSKGLNF